jgi:Protein of unknown function (DUF3305)
MMSDPNTGDRADENTAPSDKPALERYERMPVGVIVERRKARNPWDDYVWRAVAVVPGAPQTETWSIVREEPDATQYFAGSFELELHPRETGLYRENLQAATPSAYVVMQQDPSAAPHGLAVRAVTLSPGDAEAYMDAVSTVEPVPMPEVLVAWLEDYIAAFHVEQEFRKRKRKPHDPRKGFGRGSGSNDYGPSTE